MIDIYNTKINTYDRMILIYYFIRIINQLLSLTYFTKITNTKYILIVKHFFRFDLTIDTQANFELSNIFVIIIICIIWICIVDLLYELLVRYEWCLFSIFSLLDYYFWPLIFFSRYNITRSFFFKFKFTTIYILYVPPDGINLYLSVLNSYRLNSIIITHMSNSFVSW